MTLILLKIKPLIGLHSAELRRETAKLTKLRNNEKLITNIKLYRNLNKSFRREYSSVFKKTWKCELLAEFV